MERAIRMSCLKNRGIFNIITIFICIIASQWKSDVSSIWKFYYNRDVHNVSLNKKFNFIPAPHLIWYIDSQIPENRGKEEIPAFLPSLWENLGNYAKQSWCYEIFVIHHDLRYEPFDS